MTNFIFYLSIKPKFFSMPLIDPYWVLRKYSTSNKNIEIVENNKNIERVENNWKHFFVNPQRSSLADFSSSKASNESIENTLDNFWKSIMNQLDSNQYVLVLFRIKYLDYNVATLGETQKVNKNDFDELLELYLHIFELLDEHYKTDPVDHYIVSYNIIPKDLLKSNKSLIRSYRADNLKKKLTWNTMFGTNLPNTADFKLWGHIILTKQDKKTGITIHHIRKNKSKLIFVVNIISSKEHEVIIKLKNKIILRFNDIITNKTCFKRNIITKNQSYIYKYGKIILKTVNKKTHFLTNIALNKHFNSNMIVMDIETRDIGNKKMAYCICFYDGNKEYIFYLDNYNSFDLMLEDALSYLLKAKYNKYRVYFHNLSYFDSVYIIRILAKIKKSNHYKLIPQLKDGKIINLRVNYGPGKSKLYNLYFRDSYLLMPESLDKLAKAMKVEHKSLFPIYYPGNVDLNYIGRCPDYKYFKKNLEFDKYIEYLLNFVHNKWSLKDETIKYCIQDCKSLYQVLDKFNELIFDKYNLNIHNYPTLSSLAFAIYRGHYLKDYKIPLIGGNMLNDIREGYFGGHTDMYKPSGGEAAKIYVYDVNSLYPFVMSECKMPVGNIQYFEGDIYKTHKNPYGFFLAEIQAPITLNIPILLTKAKINNVLRTLAPLGKWTGVIFSDELMNAKDFGYKIKVLKGYTFESEFIFKDFINDLYKIKSTHSKDHPMYLISKLLMYSLYGRFGMHEETFLTKNDIVNNKELIEMMEDNNILDIMNLGDDSYLITYIPNNKDNDYDSLFNSMTYFKISISLSAAITAYARIHMSQFKKSDNKYNLLYSDTDSIAIDQPLPDDMISNELGKMKLEYIFQRAVYLGGSAIQRFMVE